ncbi:MAG: MTAP family purine nucleoside phosphorylase [Tepidisphaeraceae bacterium]
MSELRIGVIGGSGIGSLLTSEASTVVNVIDTPFGAPSAPITEVDWHGVKVLLLPRHGVGHVLNPSRVPYRANIYALKKLGVTHILATGAVGSLRQEFAPRDLVIADQVIDKTHKRANTFFDGAAVHVEFAEPFCPVLRKLLTDAAEGGTAKRTPPPATSRWKGRRFRPVLKVTCTGSGAAT